MKLLFDNSDQHVSGDSAPDLRLHRVLAVADETLDAQMLLNPLEEQFDLPATLVKRADRCSRQRKVVGQEHQRLAGFRVFEADTPQLLWIILRDVVAVQGDALVADDSRTPVDRHRVHPVRIHAALGSGHEERSGLMQREQAGEIQIAAIHDAERSCFEGQHIQHVDLVCLAVRDMDEGGDVAAQVEQGVQLYRSLGSTKWRPWKQRQAQVYGRRIQCINGAVQIDTEAVVAIQLARTSDEQGGQVLPYVPVASFVGIGQRRTFDWRAKAHAVQLRLIGQQAGFDVAQTLAVSQLREGHGAELLRATQTAHSGIAAITRHDARKAGPRNELHNLCEQRLAHVHSSPPENSISGRYLNWNMGELISNRHQHKSLCKPRQYSILAREFVS